MGLFSKKEDKYITRVMGFHNPNKGVVYRKIKVKKKTFNDPKWQKKNPHLYDTFKRPMPKKMPPLNVYNPASNKKYMAG
tara:strand:- start:292 stop:528 length:237 start_codon:yes stop_codon:yes gene_type:complete